MCEALDVAGYDSTNSSHWLISCGDNFDRGPENFKVMRYFLRQPRCILVRGNHEDLLDCACTEGISMRDYPNGTVDTIEELGASAARLDWTMNDKMDLTFKRTRGFFDRMIDFYETKNYVFVHGWIPSLKLYPDWRKAPAPAWEKARWENGMKAARSGYLDPTGKTIVCGHYHTSWGHHIQSGTPEWGEGSDFRIYSAMHDAGITPPRAAAVEGFLDEKGNFYNRYEAYDIAMTNGQMSATARHYKMDKGERELFSEDLY